MHLTLPLNLHCRVNKSRKNRWWNISHVSGIPCMNISDPMLAGGFPSCVPILRTRHVLDDPVPMGAGWCPEMGERPPITSFMGAAGDQDDRESGSHLSGEWMRLMRSCLGMLCSGLSLVFLLDGSSCRAEKRGRKRVLFIRFFCVR